MENIQRLRGSRHLRRLEMLIDVVFALLIWDIVSTLPIPGGSDLDVAGLGEFIGGNLDFGVVLIGIVIVLNYWAQNNAHSGELEATDSTHALLSILQLFFLLFYTYAAALGMQFEGDETALALQSFTLLIAGVLPGLATGLGFLFFSLFFLGTVIAFSEVSLNVFAARVEKAFAKTN